MVQAVHNGYFDVQEDLSTNEFVHITLTEACGLWWCINPREFHDDRYQGRQDYLKEGLHNGWDCL